jgi:hypothetical protein
LRWKKVTEKDVETLAAWNAKSPARPPSVTVTSRTSISRKSSTLILLGRGQCSVGDGDPVFDLISRNFRTRFCKGQRIYRTPAPFPHSWESIAEDEEIAVNPMQRAALQVEPGGHRKYDVTLLKPTWRFRLQERT